MPVDNAHRPVVLFLQGPPSAFWPELADAVEARGMGVRRVDLNAADQLFWRRPGAVRYRGSLRAWRRWILAYMRAEGVTDLLYYADRMPYHRLARMAARRVGARVWAVEFGYLRPDWLTFEPEGGGAYSRFAAEPDALPDAPKPDLRVLYPHPFWREAASEVGYNLAMTAGRPLFPLYASDKYYAPVFDYLCWIPRLARGWAEKRHARRVQKRLLRSGAPFNLVALQMQSDYQLRASSPYRHQAEMIREIVASFAAHAPPDRRLVVKGHPLDNGWERWGTVLRRAAREAGIGDRVAFIDGGDLGKLIAASRGVVLANSTVGLHALRAGRPVKPLGAAVYDMNGLTHQGPLDAFWTAPDLPDQALVARFVAAIAAEIQVKGSIYNPDGRRAAAAEIADRLADPPRRGAHGPPPRLRALKNARAARLRRNGLMTY